MRQLRVAIVMALLVGPGNAGAGEQDNQWLLKHIKESAVSWGPLGWQGLRAGSFVRVRCTNEVPTAGGGPRKTASEERATLTRWDGDTAVITRETRSPSSKSWTPSFTQNLAKSPKSPATPTLKDLGKETLDVAGEKLACKKSVYEAEIRGQTVALMTLWVHPKRGLVKWVRVEGNWTSTFTVKRWKVQFAVGERKLDCVELSRHDKASNMAQETTGLELWSPAVPDFVVRQALTRKSQAGGQAMKQSQVRELVEFAARKAAVKSANSPKKTTPKKAPSGKTGK